MSLRRDIAHAITTAVIQAQEQGSLPAGEVPEAVVERPERPEHGDFATSLPLRLARAFRLEPYDIARRIAAHLSPTPPIQRAWAAPPGFINFLLDAHWLTHQVEVIRQVGEAYGTSTVGKGERILLEFVSVNPTGPIHVGHTRGAVLGSTLANILTAAGYDVTREYYVNDAGSQMESFYRSLYARYLQALGRQVELPPQGYRGEYLLNLAQEVVQEHGSRLLETPEEEAVAKLGEVGLDKMLLAIREDLKRVGVEFDVWFRERDVYRTGRYEAAMSLLREGGYLTEREGAVWFTSTSLGEDKDNVLVRSTGQPTYFASDVAYHYDKFLHRGFQRAINIWGADHQGHVSRMKAVAQTLGIDPNRLVIIIAQMVSLKRGQELLKVSKRSGELITLRELVEEVGSDACRYFFLARSPESQMDFDLELAKEQSANNPVYYVQYAHARIASILRYAQEQGVDYADGDVTLLGEEAELALIRRMVQLPELVESMAGNLEAHHLPRYAVDLATAFHWFYQQCRVVSSYPEDLPLTKARLKLVETAQLVLARSLHLMGMGAPEQM